MTALEYLKSFDYLPIRNTQCAKVGRNGRYNPSLSETKRWLMNGSVLINGVYPKPGDEIQFPIRQLIFFPNSRVGPCTYFDE